MPKPPFKNIKSDSGVLTLRKRYALKVASIEDNVLKGAASVIGNMDRGGDLILLGFYSDALDGFCKAGFVATGHKWDELPVAMPTMAEEKDDQLYTEATYHSTQAAQDARTVAMERKAAGLDVGLSVGFSMARDGWKAFANGAALLTWVTSNGYLADTPSSSRVPSLAGRRFVRVYLQPGVSEISVWDAPVYSRLFLGEKGCFLPPLKRDSDRYCERTNSLIAVISSIAKRTPSRPNPESRSPP